MTTAKKRHNQKDDSEDNGKKATAIRTMTATRMEKKGDGEDS